MAEMANVFMTLMIVDQCDNPFHSAPVPVLSVMLRRLSERLGTNCRTPHVQRVGSSAKRESVTKQSEKLLEWNSASVYFSPSCPTIPSAAVEAILLPIASLHHKSCKHSGTSKVNK